MLKGANSLLINGGFNSTNRDQLQIKYVARTNRGRLKKVFLNYHYISQLQIASFSSCKISVPLF